MSVTPLDFTLPTNGGDDGLWGVELNTALQSIKDWATSIQNAVVLKSIMADPAAPFVATVGGDGIGDQPPAPHTHPITVKDSGGNTFSGTGLDVYAGSGAVALDGITGLIKLLISPADVTIKRVKNSYSVTNTTALISVSDLDFIVPTGKSYDFGGIVAISSNNTAGARIQVQSGASTTFNSMFLQPHYDPANVDTGGTTTSQILNSGDVLKFRTGVITIPTNGPQQVGGYTSAGSTSWSLWYGNVTNNTGSDKTISWKMAQAVPNGVATTVVPGLSRVAYSLAV